MSHVRNLFHKPWPQEQPPGVATIVAPERSSAAGTVAVAPAETIAIAPPETTGVSTAVRTVRDIRECPVEQARILPEHRLAYHTEPRGRSADRFRLLRMRLKEAWESGKLKKLLITSALPGDGKTTVTLNLATALAERGKRSVLLLEADLHHSHIPQILGLTASAGVTECVQNGLDPLSAIKRVDPLGWWLMGAGEPRNNPTELLQSPAFGKMLASLVPLFDWVLIDSPPVVLLTDSISLQKHADATLMVVRANRTPRAAVEQTVALLGSNKIAGIVVNGAPDNRHAYSNYGYDYRPPQ